MNIKTLRFIVIVLCIVAAAWGVVVFTGHNHPPGDATDIYYCPMHPHYTSDRPGKCPICGMDLVKKEPQVSQEAAPASVAGDHASVNLSDDQQQLMGVRVVPVVRKPFVKTIRAYGYLAHDFELYDAQLEYIEAWREYFTFRKIRRVKEEFREDWKDYYRNPGPLARSEEFRKTQYRLIKAEYELRHMGLNENQLEQLRMIKIRQPWVQPDLLFLEEAHPVWVYAKVFEDDLGYVDVGQKAVVEVPAYREFFEGIVRNVAGQIDPETRTAIVRIELPQAKDYLKIDMFTNVLFPVELNDAYVIPRDALMDTGSRKIVFVQTAPGHYEPRDVKTGLQADGTVEVKEGLKEGELVVAQGNFLVDSESRLQAALSGMTSSGEHRHGQ